MEKVDFIVVESRGSHETLACPKCGCMFDIDAYLQENMIWDKEYVGLVSKCPDCGVIQIGVENG